MKKQETDGKKTVPIMMEMRYPPNGRCLKTLEAQICAFHPKHITVGGRPLTEEAFIGSAYDPEEAREAVQWLREK